MRLLTAPKLQRDPKTVPNFDRVSINLTKIKKQNWLSDAIFPIKIKETRGLSI